MRGCTAGHCMQTNRQRYYMFSQSARLHRCVMENPGSNDPMQMPKTGKLANLFGLPAHHIAVLQGCLEAVPVPGVDSIWSTIVKSARNVVSLSVSAFTGAVKTTKAAHRQID